MKSVHRPWRFRRIRTKASKQTSVLIPIDNPSAMPSGLFHSTQRNIATENSNNDNDNLKIVLTVSFRKRTLLQVAALDQYFISNHMGNRFGASLCRVQTTRCEGTTYGPCFQTGEFHAFERQGFHALYPNLQSRHGLKQGFGVRVSGIGQDAVDASHFHDFAQIHDTESTVFGDVSCCRQIVGDVYEGYSKLLIQVRHEIQQRKP